MCVTLGRKILRSWDCALLMYLSITNKMQRYTMVFITINALHISGGSSAQHQELKTVYTESGICWAFTACMSKLGQVCLSTSKPVPTYSHKR